MGNCKGEMMTGKIDVPELQGVLELAGVDKVSYGYNGKPGKKKSIRTLCKLISKGKIVAWGWASKSPLDAFCYATGRSIALRRAVNRLDTKNRRNK